MNFQDDIPSIPIDNFKDHYVLVFDLTRMQDAIENCHYPELVGEPLRLELNFTCPLEQVTELKVLGERMSLVSFDAVYNEPQFTQEVSKIVSFFPIIPPKHTKDEQDVIFRGEFYRKELIKIV